MFQPTPQVTFQQPLTPKFIARDTAHRDSLHTRKKPLERNDYHISFIPQYVLTQLDNSFLDANYQPYININGPSYQQPGFSAFIKVGLADLFEDYRIEGDARIAVDLSTNEYELSFADYSKRLDKILKFHREALLGIDNNGYSVNVYTHDAAYEVRWPFSEVSRIQGSIGVLEGKAILLASDVPSLQEANQYEVMPKLEATYVYDPSSAGATEH